MNEQKAVHIRTKEEMFAKVTQRVELKLKVLTHSSTYSLTYLLTHLTTYSLKGFVDDIKFMQRTLKKELADLESSERDLRRLFEDETGVMIKAEKLTFILEGWIRYTH